MLQDEKYYTKLPYAATYNCARHCACIYATDAGSFAAAFISCMAGFCGLTADAVPVSVAIKQYLADENF